jgi:hypothetical protein
MDLGPRAVNGVQGPLAGRLDAASVLVGHQDRDDGLALVAGATEGLEAHQRRRPLAVVVADV